MAFPDRIERVVELPHAPARVWAAISTVEGLGTWFGNQATGAVRTGAVVQLTWTEGQQAELRIERVEPPSVLGYTWHVEGLGADDPRRTYVEFTLEAAAGGGTRLTVVESGFAQLAEDEYRKSYDGNVEGWAHELGELAAYLDAA